MLHRQTGSGCSTNQNCLYGDVVASGSEVKFDSLFPDLAIVAEMVTGHHVENVYVTQSVCIHGCDYRIGCALVVKYEFDETPVLYYNQLKLINVMFAFIHLWHIIN